MLPLTSGQIRDKEDKAAEKEAWEHLGVAPWALVGFVLDRSGADHPLLQHMYVASCGVSLSAT